jgi:hypothetical protein
MAGSPEATSGGDSRKGTALRLTGIGRRLTGLRRRISRDVHLRVPHAFLAGAVVIAFLAGCATTDDGISQKDREKMAREMEKANRKDAQNQSKMMRDVGGQRRTSR